MSQAAKDSAGSQAHLAASKAPDQASTRAAGDLKASDAPTSPDKTAVKGAEVGANPAHRVETQYLGGGAGAASRQAPVLASGAAASPSTPHQTDSVTGVEKGGSAERQDWVHQASVWARC